MRISGPSAVALDVGVWAAWSLFVGLIAHRLPVHRLEHDSRLLRLRSFELDGSWFRRLRVRRWKDHLPEAGALFAGGFSKRRLARRRTEYLERFTIETRRAELTHWWAMAIVPVFALWNPWWVLLVMLAYALVANVPCIVVQRFNRACLLRVLHRARVAAPRQ